MMKIIPVAYIFIWRSLNSFTCGLQSSVPMEHSSRISFRRISGHSYSLHTSKLFVQQEEITMGSTPYIDPSKLSVEEAKKMLLDVAPNMTGKNILENDMVEGLVNRLEEHFKDSPVSKIQTVNFLKLAIQGKWDLIMSTNMVSKTDTNDEDDFVEGPTQIFRILSPLEQVINTESNLISNKVQWELITKSENANEQDDILTGFFESKSQYELVNQSTRLFLTLKGHGLDNKSKRVPTGSEINGLIPRFIDGMTFELFDPNGLSMDTTYIDADMRIVRYTAEGRNSEGVRNVFLRQITQEN